MFITPLVAPSLSWEIPRDILEKFDDYVKMEESRIAGKLDLVDYTIDDSAISIVVGGEGLEKVCTRTPFPLYVQARDHFKLEHPPAGLFVAQTASRHLSSRSQRIYRARSD